MRKGKAMFISLLDQKKILKRQISGTLSYLDQSRAKHVSNCFRKGIFYHKSRKKLNKVRFESVAYTF